MLLLKIIKYLRAFLLKPIYKIHLWLHKVKVGSNSKVNGFPYIRNEGVFKIGNNVVINSKYNNNPIGGNVFSSFWIKPGGSIVIQDSCGISNSAFVSAKSITIGKNVYIGGDCRFYDTDFHSMDIVNRLLKDDPDVRSAEIVIEDNVFIGASNIILKGVRIGANSIIGAGSVVTKSIPANEIWGGNPAKFIKKLSC